MFEAMRLAGILHNRGTEEYSDWPSPEQILRAATSQSAHALGYGGRLGALAPGQLADIVMMDRNSFPFVPLNDPIKQLVYCENGISVSDVMIDGRWVLRKRKLVTMDEAAVYAKANDLRAEMDERVQEQFRHTRELEPALHAAYLKTAKTTWSERDGS